MASALVAGMTSCSDFLDKEPLSSATEAIVFKNATQFQQAADEFINDLPNGYYGSFDGGTDITGLGSNGGGAAPESNGNWSGNYTNIRQYNILLQKAEAYTGDKAAINGPVGTAYFFRGMAYFNLLKIFGGVPIGVPIPPRLAAIGMLMVNATRPLPLAGRAAKTGVRKVSIMAAVAVLETNMEKRPVISKKPRSTFSLFVPKGRMRLRAKSTSSPDLVAAAASIKPPRKSMMVGSAKEAMMCLESISSPMFSPLKGINALSDTVRHIMVMMPSDVAQEGMHSVSHENVANTKIAMMRCWTMVRPSIPNT